MLSIAVVHSLQSSHMQRLFDAVAVLMLWRCFGCCSSSWSWTWHQSHPRSQGEEPQQEQVQVCQ